MCKVVVSLFVHGRGRGLGMKISLQSNLMGGLRVCVCVCG